MAAPRNRRPGFSRRAQYSRFLAYVIAIAGALVGAVLLALSQINPPAFSALRAGAAEVTAPVSYAGGAVVSGIGSVPEWIGSFFGVRSENARLKATTARDQQLLLRARAIAYENIRLKKLLDMREPGEADIVHTRIVSSSAGSTRRYGLIYAGIAQGVHAGMPVRGSEGIIGRVIEAGPDTARVLLLIDPESIIPVRRLKDGAAGFISGRGDGLLDVKPITLANGQFAVGDILVTSGTGGIFPPNIPVAKVTSRTRETSLAQPFVRIEAFDYATVMRAFMPPPPPPAPGK